MLPKGIRPEAKYGILHARCSRSFLVNAEAARRTMRCRAKTNTASSDSRDNRIRGVHITLRGGQRPRVGPYMPLLHLILGHRSVLFNQCFQSMIHSKRLIAGEKNYEKESYHVEIVIMHNICIFVKLHKFLCVSL